MYWLASVSTWTPNSSSRKPAGTTIFLVITAAVGSAMATFLVRVASFFHPRFTVSTTASRLVILPSTTASLGRSSIT